MTAPTTPFLQQDFLPFQAGVDAGAGCVLVSHNIVTCKDGDMPASLSPTWHQVLREELGFSGCVITDDLVMDAIQDYCDASSAAVQAVLAGNDLLCCSDYETQVPAVCWPPWRTAPSRKSGWRNPPCGCSSGKRGWACCETIKKEALRRLLFRPQGMEGPPRGAPMERGAGIAVRESKREALGAPPFCFLETRWLGEWFWERRRKPSLCQGPANPTERQRKVFRKATCRLYPISGEMVTILWGFALMLGSLPPHPRPRGFAIKMSGLP